MSVPETLALAIPVKAVAEAAQAIQGGNGVNLNYMKLCMVAAVVNGGYNCVNGGVDSDAIQDEVQSVQNDMKEQAENAQSQFNQF